MIITPKHYSDKEIKIVHSDSKNALNNANLTNNDDYKLELRHLTAEDHADISDIMDVVYAGLGGAWTEQEYQAQLARFPAGQIGIEDDGKIVAAVLSIIVNYDDYGDKHNYTQITGDGKFTTHNPTGDTLYGIDIFIDPDYRGLRLGRRLYDARKELCESLNLQRIIVGARIPGYTEHSASLTPNQYVKQVRLREIHDSVLSFQLSNDFHVRKVMRGYMPEDEASQGYAAILQWNNINYEEAETPLVGAQKTTVRIGALQWQMRSVSSLEQMLDQVRFFISTVGTYNADFAMLPEFWSAPLMGLKTHDNSAEAIRALAEYSNDILAALSEMAVTYNVNIIGGSIAEYDGTALYNVSPLCRRDGSVDKQYKLHITPDEKQSWGLQGGNHLKTFDTDAGKIGILICYDSEFPELSRHLAEQGVQILFVPYWTDNKSGYLRVRHCCAARAIENECYVVMTGSVGNLPKVSNMDIQYSQSAVLTPSDFAFPHDAILAEATPNTEMTLVADLNLDLLKNLHERGSVKNLKDRRKDLFKLEWLK